ncbi:hypothetical protein BG004_003429 [Podila humilis]|nr:hypothetical protein BG004_003429 [Podila humilis]
MTAFVDVAECLASAGDDGNIILWRPSETKEAVNRFAESDDDEFERERWRVQSMMRGSLSDIYDLAWSPDGRFIISGSIDNTARIWDVRDADHHHYVQGVAWDPLGEFVATQSSDRTVHIYAFKLDKNGHITVTSLGKNSKLDLSKLRSIPQQSVPNTSSPALSTDKSAKDKEKEIDDTSKSTVGRSQPKSFRLYHDETLTSFFRRLSFTPDGSMLLTPSGQYKAPVQKTAALKEDDTSSSNAAVAPFELETRNTAYIYARWNFNRGPIAHLPGHKKPSVAIKCSPVLYELRKQVQPPGAGDTNRRPSTAPSTASTNISPSHPTSTIPSSAATRSSAKEAAKIPTVFGLGYRSVYAVATQDSILIYDTQQTAALALVSHLHYATFTDMTWSSDGCNLILTSSDGFCSIISFDEGELGVVYTPPASMIALLPPSSALSSTDSGILGASAIEPLDASAAVAATAGMLQKLNGLSLTEQKAKCGNGNSTASSDKQESAQDGAKKGGRKAPKGARKPAATTSATPDGLASIPAATAISGLSFKSANSSPALKTAGHGRAPFKTERDGDSVMEAASNAPTPKKRRIQHTVESLFPGSSTTPSPSLSPASAPSPAPSPAKMSSLLFANSRLSTPTTATTNDAKPKKRIQPTFVSALPGP